MTHREIHTSTTLHRESQQPNELCLPSSYAYLPSPDSTSHASRSTPTPPNRTTPIRTRFPNVGYIQLINRPAQPTGVLPKSPMQRQLPFSNRFINHRPQRDPERLSDNTASRRPSRASCLSLAPRGEETYASFGIIRRAPQGIENASSSSWLMYLPRRSETDEKNLPREPSYVAAVSSSRRRRVERVQVDSSRWIIVCSESSYDGF